jgi:hypothetical protein
MEMKQTPWEETSPHTRRAWRDTRSYMLQENLVAVTVSGKQLRKYLCQLLWWIEQFSAQGLNALCSPLHGTDVTDLLPFTGKACIGLVCVSVSVIATPGSSVSLRSVLDDPYQHLIREMEPELEKSTIFQNGLSPEELRNAFTSLESIILSRRSDRAQKWARSPFSVFHQAAHPIHVHPYAPLVTKIEDRLIFDLDFELACGVFLFRVSIMTCVIMQIQMRHNTGVAGVPVRISSPSVYQRIRACI